MKIFSLIEAILNAEGSISVEGFLLLNGIVLGILIIYISRRKRQKTIRLKFSKAQGATTSMKEVEENLEGSFLSVRVVSNNVLSEDDGVMKSKSNRDKAKVKTLNVIFNYNGHSWDAYEVFGLPAGSSLTVVEKAYKRVLGNVEPESQEFIDTAYKAIVKKVQ